jgi:4-hydroxy-tetrahydrodipicolinate synthase
MANFHPELYSWLCANFEKSPELAARVQNFLGVVSAMESRMYPICAKKYVKKFFFPEMSDFGRSADRNAFTPSFETELLELEALVKELVPVWGIDLKVKI